MKTIELKPYDIITSDLHLFHWNINRLCNRGFSSLEEMNETLINQINEKSKEKGKYVSLWHLGDLLFAKNNKEYRKNIEWFLSKINIPYYMIHLIIGNHDKREILSDFFPDENLHFYIETGCFIRDEKRFQRLVLFHYPILSWNGKNKKYVHFFGHTHTLEHHKDNMLYMNVGWDLHKKPLEVLEAIDLVQSMYGENPELFP